MKMSFTAKIWLTTLLLPLILHIAVSFTYAYGDYDGKHCAGLLGATWECSELEYYLDYIFDGFGIFNLFFYYVIAVVLAVTLLIFRKLYTLKKPKT